MNAVVSASRVVIVILEISAIVSVISIITVISVISIVSIVEAIIPAKRIVSAPLSRWLPIRSAAEVITAAAKVLSTTKIPLPIISGSIEVVDVLGEFIQIEIIVEILIRLVKAIRKLRVAKGILIAAIRVEGSIAKATIIIWLAWVLHKWVSFTRAIYSKNSNYFFYQIVRHEWYLFENHFAYFDFCRA